MAGIQDFKEYVDDFIGASVALPTSANIATPWVTALTGGATHVRNASELIATLTATNEAQIVGVAHADALSFNIDNMLSFEARFRISAATFTSGSILAVGVGSARNNTLDSVTAHAWFRMTGATSTTQIYVETDDDVRDNNMIATGQTLKDVYKKFHIDFSNKADVKFYIDGIRVAAATRFDMSAYAGGFQPIIQLQKAANTNVDAMRVDYVRIRARRK